MRIFVSRLVCTQHYNAHHKFIKLFVRVDTYKLMYKDANNVNWVTRLL